MALYTISLQPFYDSYTQNYRNIYVIDRKPGGIFASIVKQIHPPKLSPFIVNSNDGCYNPCIYAIYSPTNPQNFFMYRRFRIVI